MDFDEVEASKAFILKEKLVFHAVSKKKSQSESIFSQTQLISQSIKN